MAKNKKPEITVPNTTDKVVKGSKNKKPEITVPNTTDKVVKGSKKEKPADAGDTPSLVVSDKVADPVTGAQVKPKALTVFKTLNGNMKLPIYINDKRGDEVKVYAHFKDSTLATADAQYIKELQKKIDEYDELGTPLKARDVLTEEQYLSIVSPDKLYVPYKGSKLHLSRVEEGLKVAEAHGWVPDFSEVIERTTKSSRVRSGSISAGSAG